MATTNAKLALEALDAMREAGVGFALLHGRDRLLAGEVSDVDLVVSEPVSKVLPKVRELWKSKGLLPVVVWPYDIGGTKTVFLATQDASEGVQLDLLFDPDGVGKYGVRSAPLLASAEGSSFPPTVSAESELIYLWRKRSIKDQPEARLILSRRIQEFDHQDLVLASQAITGSSHTASNLFNGTPATRPVRLAGPAFRSVWLTRRLLTPVGYWVHTSHRAIANDLARRFRRFLVTVVTASAPVGIARVSWWATRVQPLRLRPGLFLSQGSEALRWPSPDLTLTTESRTDAARELTAAMSARIP